MKAGDEMAWVSVHDNVMGGKLRELAKEIGCTQEEALGILVSLWIWGLNNADKDGKLVSADREDVLEAFSVKMVSGLKVDIVDTLVKTRWMDEPEPGSLYIHDWDQWQEQWYKAIERREKDAKRKAEYRQGKRSEQDRAGVAGKKNGGLNQEALWGNDGGPEALAQSEEPRYAPAKDGYSDAELLEAAQNYAIDCRRRKTEKEYIKHPKTFLSDSLPFLDYLPKKEEPREGPGMAKTNPFAEWGENT